MYRVWYLLQKSEDGARSSGTGVRASLGCHVGAGNWILALLQEQPIFLSTEAFLQHCIAWFQSDNLGVWEYQIVLALIFKWQNDFFLYNLRDHHFFLLPEFCAQDSKYYIELTWWKNEYPCLLSGLRKLLVPSTTALTMDFLYTSFTMWRHFPHFMDVAMECVDHHFFIHSPLVSNVGQSMNTSSIHWLGFLWVYTQKLSTSKWDHMIDSSAFNL